MKKEFSKEELIQMIEEKGLKIVLVPDVKPKTFPSYKTVIFNEEEIEKELSLYELTLEDSKYMLLSEEEIKHVNQKGYLL